LSIVAGLHTPVIPFNDIVGKDGTLLPAQKLKTGPKANIGTTLGVTVTVNVVGEAQTPLLGVKV